MEEINLKELLDFFISKIFMIVIFFVSVLLIGSVYSIFLKTPLYKSNTTILLVNKNTTVTQTEVMMNQNLVTTYSEIIKSRKILSSVKKNLKLKDSIDTLSNMVSVASVNDTEIITVSVSNKDNKLACSVANEIARVFTKEIKRLYNLENVTIIDKAQVSNNPYNISLLKELLLYSLVGITLGCGVVFILFYFDSTIKSKQEIEDKLGIPVIGRVPFMEVK